MRKLIDLTVVTPSVSILPPGELHVQAGSHVQLTCVVDQVIHVPDHVVWIKDGKVRPEQFEIIDVAGRKKENRMIL